jgi:hypothetical protein
MDGISSVDTAGTDNGLGVVIAVIGVGVGAVVGFGMCHTCCCRCRWLADAGAVTGFSCIANRSFGFDVTKNLGLDLYKSFLPSTLTY